MSAFRGQCFVKQKAKGLTPYRSAFSVQEGQSHQQRGKGPKWNLDGGNRKWKRRMSINRKITSGEVGWASEALIERREPERENKPQAQS